MTWGTNWCTNWCHAGDFFSKFDSYHVSLLFMDVLISGFVKYVTNLVNNIWFTVNSKSISLVHLTWSRTPLACTAATAVNVLVSQILILKGSNYIELLTHHSLLVPYYLNFLYGINISAFPVTITY